MDSAGRWVLKEDDLLACCGSTKFAKQMAAISPFTDLHHAVQAAKDIWFNKVDVNGWLEAFSAHPQIGQSPSSSITTDTSAQWSKGEQSTAIATATSTTLQELTEWNAKYKQKFGFVFLICASGRSTAEILVELKRRYPNRPVIEFETAAQEQMKITELRLAKLFSANSSTAAAIGDQPASVAMKAHDRLNMINAHLISANVTPGESKSQVPKRNRPPITTHVLDMARGLPGAGIDVQLETWRGPEPCPQFPGSDSSCWTLVGSGKTDNDGRSNPLMNIVDAVSPGIYRISFNTGKYNPSCFFPFVSIVFQITESQKFEHFHVPLLLAPFGFSTYRGS
ncbi:uric acid degradation bifunctional protein TTL isoform X3 [Beta vulgaris subsp. vulgaris]|uniref:uric acid degradation bifunctional protein TTL isoform X3 n=1 Tax=Beta vulgaris subsp. vulgaris TaxID=3555 RepID=UPI00053F82F2|nr:uric acid degradation bifunctional protein TTL isoform X3 [Beta vulgaris subsp. vulgaris]